MKITLFTSGGFAGISLPPRVLETEDETIISLANEALAAKDAETMAGMDLMSYEITITDGRETSHIHIEDRLPPQKVQELVDCVMSTR